MVEDADSTTPTGIQSTTDVELSIDEAVSRVEKITSQLDDGAVSLGTGKQLYEEAQVLIDYIEQEAQVDEVGDVEELSN